MSGDALLADLLLDDGTTERFLASRGSDSDADYQVVAIVEGRCPSAPTHAVFAKWIVENEANNVAFEESRRALFALRRQNIDSFVCDALLRRRDSVPTEYVVVGFYGDEAGRSAARSHPAIAEWAAAHPPASMSAVDTTGMKFAAVMKLERS
jgi:hypothetical protein